MSNIVSTSAVTLMSSMGTDRTVVNAARVSMAKHSTRFSEADAKLIRFLAKNNHWTPFAHVMFTFRIAMPAFVARQWFKHTVGIVRNEVSRRYVDSDVQFYLPDVVRARPDGSIKQGSGGEHPDSEKHRRMMRAHFDDSADLYERLIGDGVAPEQARIVLPLAHMTEFYETASLAAYARICCLRMDGHAQAEIRDVATQVARLVADVVPVSLAELVESDERAVTAS